MSFSGFLSSMRPENFKHNRYNCKYKIEFHEEKLNFFKETVDFLKGYMDSLEKKCLGKN